ncbi:MAG: hypothetical protein FH748_07140 [Balneolaceae bacterium]|nr:hypothetical protein [Balneolaceae bacterium]
MSTVDRETIENLIDQTTDTNISIFIPTHEKGEEGKQDPIRLKNILQKVKKDLQHKDWKEQEVENLFKEVYELIDENQFWLHQDKGLALYLNKNYFDYFKIPVTPSEDYHIANNFFITPLLELQNHHGVFHILALSQNGTRILKSTPDNLKVLNIESVPTTMKEHLKYHVHEKSIQLHSSGSNGTKAMFHGQGGDKSDNDKELKLFFSHIENKVTKYLKKINGPLVLAGTEKNVSIYREANHYYNLMDEHIPGNPDEKSAKELNNEAWPLVKTFFAEGMQSDIERYKNMTGSDLISADISDIVRGAHFGKVDTLFVPMNSKQWGTFDSNNNHVELASTQNGEAHELINLAAVSAIKNGSTLYGLSQEEMPETTSLAAIYRYKT